MLSMASGCLALGHFSLTHSAATLGGNRVRGWSSPACPLPAWTRAGEEQDLGSHCPGWPLQEDPMVIKCVAGTPVPYSCA